MKPYEERLAEARSYLEAAEKRVSETPSPEGQKFLPGTFVMIAKDLGLSMRHFPSGIAARVEYTYAHAYGGWNIKSYSLKVRHVDLNSIRWVSVSWFYEDQLTEITDEKLIAGYKEELGAV